MIKTISKSTNKATLIAAALIITGATAIFSTYAASEETAPNEFQRPLACLEMVKSLSDEDKEKMEEAHGLMKSGDFESARIIIDELRFKHPKSFGSNKEVLKNLTDEQRDKLNEAHSLVQNGRIEEAKTIFDELGLKGPGPRPEKGFGGRFGKRMNEVE